MGKDYVLPMEENRNITIIDGDSASFETTSSDKKDLETEDIVVEVSEKDVIDVANDIEVAVAVDKKPTDREEYDSLVKGRFKDLYAEDTQRLINRRFRKYKVMEERFKLLEEDLARKETEISEHQQRIADFEARLRSEVEKAIKETEEKIIGELRAKKLRPSENGTSPRRSNSPFDVSRLTKVERATLAKRAASGEKIKF